MNDAAGNGTGASDSAPGPAIPRISKAYVWDKALRLASSAEYAALPDLLKAAMKGKPNDA